MSAAEKVKTKIIFLKKQKRKHPLQEIRESYIEDIVHEMYSREYAGFGQAWSRKALLRKEIERRVMQE